MADEDATSKPLPIPFISPVTDIIMADYNKSFKRVEQIIINQELLKAKSEGLNAVRKYINSQEHNYDKGFDWRLMEISNETANQLLNGKFKTFNDLETFEFDNRDFTQNIAILYKIHKNLNKGKNDHIIESIFLKE